MILKNALFFKMRSLLVFVIVGLSVFLLGGRWSEEVGDTVSKKTDVATCAKIVVCGEDEMNEVAEKYPDVVIASVTKKISSY